MQTKSSSNAIIIGDILVGNSSSWVLVQVFCPSCLKTRNFFLTTTAMRLVESDAAQDTLLPGNILSRISCLGPSLTENMAPFASLTTISPMIFVNGCDETCTSENPYDIVGNSRRVYQIGRKEDLFPNPHRP